MKILVASSSWPEGYLVSDLKVSRYYREKPEDFSVGLLHMAVLTPGIMALDFEGGRLITEPAVVPMFLNPAPSRWLEKIKENERVWRLSASVQDFAQRWPAIKEICLL